MPETPPFYAWPVADQRTLTMAMLLLVGLFVGAVLLELYRRRRDRRLRLLAEWRGVRELCRDRELPGEDWALLRAIIAQYAPDAPYKAVTTRKRFDACMARYFEALRATSSEDEITSRGEQLRHIRLQLGLDYVPLGQRIETTRELETGLSIWAAPATGAHPQWRHFAVDAVDEAYFHLKQVGGDEPPDFAAGDRLKCRFWREEDARYVFEAPVHRATTAPPRWTFAHVESLTRNQARAHYRVRFDHAVNAAVLSASRSGEYGDIARRPVVTHVRGRTTSISGGGLALLFEQPVPSQVLLRVPLTLPNHEGALTVHLHPVSAQPLGGGRWLLRGKFVGMDEDTREIITRYVFLKQKQRASDSQP